MNCLKPAKFQPLQCQEVLNQWLSQHYSFLHNRQSFTSSNFILLLIFASNHQSVDLILVDVLVAISPSYTIKCLCHSLHLSSFIYSLIIFIIIIVLKHKFYQHKKTTILMYYSVTKKCSPIQPNPIGIVPFFFFNYNYCFDFNPIHLYKCTNYQNYKKIYNYCLN